MRTEETIVGINGASPLGFLGAVGLLRLLDRAKHSEARLRFTQDGSFRAVFEYDESLDLKEFVANDAKRAASDRAWVLQYAKKEKKGIIRVADLKAPPDEFQNHLCNVVDAWVEGNGEGAAFAAAYGTDVAVDGKGNTKPTAFHFTAANQQFLEIVEQTRKRIDRDKVAQAFSEPSFNEEGSNLRWDPDSERSRALMATNPVDDRTSVNPVLEWLAFRALPTFICVPIGSRVMTTGVTGRRQSDLKFHWPLWSRPASYSTVRSLVAMRNDSSEPTQRHARGVFALCTSEIRRTAQGFGNFGPARVTT